MFIASCPVPFVAPSGTICFLDKRSWRSYRSALVARAAQAINILLLRSKDINILLLRSKDINILLLGAKTDESSMLLR